MQGPKENKEMKPAVNKQALVKIKFRAGRAADGVTMDADGFAFVDAQRAEYLIKINYAVMAEENKDGK